MPEKASEVFKTSEVFGFLPLREITYRSLSKLLMSFWSLIIPRAAKM